MKPVIAAIVTYNRLEFTQRCIRAFFDTVDPATCDLWISDNGSTDGTLAWLDEAQAFAPSLHVIKNGENIGTARAINRVWKHREPGQHAAKIDNDAVMLRGGWMEQMLEVFARIPSIGLLGLKRKDLMEKCRHPKDPAQPHDWFKSQLYETGEGQFIEVVHHVMGTCTVYQSAALDKIGFLYQMQDEGNLYGFDDSLASVRLEKAGFESAFLRGYGVDHIDPGHNYSAWNDAHTDEKRASAGKWIPRFSEIRDGIRAGTISYYYGAKHD